MSIVENRREEKKANATTRQSVIAWQALMASAAYLSATSLQGLAINSHPNYTPERWHGTLLVFALMAVCFICNTFLSKRLPQVEAVILFLHITLFIVVISILTAMSPTKSRNADVWALFLNAGGYDSKGLSFFVGLITPVFAFSGADGTVHMSEETRNASRVIPWAMMSTSSNQHPGNMYNMLTMTFSKHCHKRPHRVLHAHRSPLLHRRHRRRTRHAHRLPLHRDSHASHAVHPRRDCTIVVPCSHVLLRISNYSRHLLPPALGLCARRRCPECESGQACQLAHESPAQQHRDNEHDYVFA